MTAYQIFRELCKENWWAGQRKSVQWIAARYYAGVETLEELRQRAKPQHVLEGHILNPELTQEELEQIVNAR